MQPQPPRARCHSTPVSPRFPGCDRGRRATSVEGPWEPLREDLASMEAWLELYGSFIVTISGIGNGLQPTSNGHPSSFFKLLL